MRAARRTLLFLLLAVPTVACADRTVSEPAAGPLRIYAAASLVDLLTALRPSLEAEAGMPVSITPGASGTLARQILRGAPADLFISASPEWTDHLRRAGHIPAEAETTCNWVRNRLACVVPFDADWVPTGPKDLASPRLQTLALATETAPVGAYARTALERAEVSVGARLVEGLNARDTLVKVALGGAEAGIVYETDVRLEPRVRITFLFDQSLHPPIVYPAAALANAPHPRAARAVLSYICQTGGRTIIEAHGFSSYSSDT